MNTLSTGAFSGDRSVRHWLSELEPYREGRAATSARLAVLGAFCAHAGKSPDELVAFCFLRKKTTGQRFLSGARRRAVNGMLEKFVAEQGWIGKEAVSNTNVVRSFLIHNGILIQGAVWRGP
ncbi:hypothetical protein BAY61_21505 [Prauserella marina]|uniref:Uncharacterized protein n=1 Tax=Prauserella marina TaxID=530584 RepID=A0A222VTD5_9PSEU|nr:hypothetical protein [Prauserella marina]ASR37140.1 hypothetical protein BAY61_21505 [Prauserella marina]PWV72446.1 hypothetical protein DES30_11044 [Prauserella marina]SDD79872.1 hypothetical protein SAMN05421630_112194 [Prauserella marina]